MVTPWAHIYVTFTCAHQTCYTLHRSNHPSASATSSGTVLHQSRAETWFYAGDPLLTKALKFALYVTTVSEKIII